MTESSSALPRKPFRAGGAGIAAEAMTAGAAASMTGVLLADISEWNPQIADAIYLAWSRAIVIRALYGDAHDDRAWYGGQRRAALHAGGARFLGIYIYLVAGQSGAAQARAFHSLVGAIQPGEVFIADYEEGAKSVLTDWYNEMRSLYGAGITPHLWTYAGLNFGAANGALPVEWLAAYRQAEPSSPHKLWQFTDAFPVPGVGSADCSVFHGSISELAALAYQPQQKPPPPPPPPPPADWTYGPPRSLQVRAGRHNFHATWEPPAGAPEPPAAYMLWVYKGTACNRDTLVATYPRTETGAATSPDAGGLEPSTLYTLHVAASGAHVKPGVYASATFTTAHPLL